jgi:hypothetical protein
MAQYFNFTNAITSHLCRVMQDEDQAVEMVKKIKSRLIKLEERDYWIAGYGSILNERSRTKTLPNQIEAVPAHVKGWSRIFSLHCGDYSVLNVEKAKKTAQLNVVAVKVPYEDMFDFIIRERNYDIVEVPIYGADGELITENGIMVVATSEEHVSEPTDAPLPLMSYLQANIYGCYELDGTDFVNEYLANTFFYDGNGDKISINEYVSDYALTHFVNVDSNY